MGIAFGDIDGAVSEHLGNVLEGMALNREPACTGVAECMGAAVADIGFLASG